MFQETAGKVAEVKERELSGGFETRIRWPLELGGASRSLCMVFNNSFFGWAAFFLVKPSVLNNLWAITGCFL
jgi:hypothetical protein